MMPLSNLGDKRINSLAHCLNLFSIKTLIAMIHATSESVFPQNVNGSVSVEN